MDIFEIFMRFTTGVADIELFRRDAHAAADRELAHLLEQKKRVDVRDDAHRFKALHNMFFKSASNGEHVFYGFRDVSVDEAIASLVRHINRQHQWFLAEAYELFEEFVKRAYAHMGMMEPSRWPMRDFGSIRWDEVASKDYAWFMEQARNKKDAPLSMLRQLAEVLPRLQIVEKDNRAGCDLRLAVTLVGHLRHRIVHARGVIPDLDVFADDVVGKMGYSGSSRTPHLEFIRGTVLVNTADHTIHLLSVPHPDSRPPLNIRYDVFDSLIRYLLMYAHEVYLSLGGASLSRIGPPAMLKEQSTPR